MPTRRCSENPPPAQPEVHPAGGQRTIALREERRNAAHTTAALTPYFHRTITLHASDSVWTRENTEGKKKVRCLASQVLAFATLAVSYGAAYVLYRWAQHLVSQ